MVGELMDGSADVVVTGLSLNNERARVIDYSTVIYTTEIGLLIRKPGSNQPNLWAYLFIFTLDTWMLIVAAIVVLGINYFCVNSTKIKSNRHKHEGRGIQNYIALVFLAMLQLEYPITIKNVSSRTLHLSTWFFAYLIFAFYTADLTSRLTVLPEAESFASLEEATEKGYKLILLKGANGHVIFSSAAEGTPRHKIWKEVIEPNPELLAKDRKEAMNLLLTKEKHAYFSSYTNDER